MDQIVYISNYSDIVTINIVEVRKRDSQTHQGVLEALPYLEGRLLILAPNIRQEKCYFWCVLYM